MKPPYYYIDAITGSEDNIRSITLSYKGTGVGNDPDHYYCVVVIGSPIEATERTMRIIEALNHEN